MKNEKFVCPRCGKEIEAAEINSWKAAQVGRGTSEKKAASSAENGKRGGRPPLIIRKENIIVKETKKERLLLVEKRQMIHALLAGGCLINSLMEKQHKNFIRQ